MLNHTRNLKICTVRERFSERLIYFIMYACYSFVESLCHSVCWGSREFWASFGDSYKHTPYSIGSKNAFVFKSVIFCFLFFWFSPRFRNSRWGGFSTNRSQHCTLLPPCNTKHPFVGERSLHRARQALTSPCWTQSARDQTLTNADINGDTSKLSWHTTKLSGK